MADTPDMLDINQAVAWLRTERDIIIKPGALRAWCRQGRLPGATHRPATPVDTWAIPIAALQAVDPPRRGARPRAARVTERRCRVCGRVEGEEGIDAQPVQFQRVRTKAPYAGGVKIKTICNACQRAQIRALREAQKQDVPDGWLTTKQAADRLDMPVQVVTANLASFETQRWQQIHLIREASIQPLADLFAQGWLTLGAAATRMGVPVYLIKAHLDEVRHTTWETFVLIARADCDDRLHPYLSPDVAEAIAEQVEAAQPAPPRPDGWLTIGEAATRLSQPRDQVLLHLDEFETRSWRGETLIAEASIAPPQGWLTVRQTAECLGISPQAVYQRLDDFAWRNWYGKIHILESSVA